MHDLQGIIFSWGFQLPFSLIVVVILWPPDVIKTSPFSLASWSCFHPLSSCKPCFAAAFFPDKDISGVNWTSFSLVRCLVQKQVNWNVLKHLKLSTVQLFLGKKRKKKKHWHSWAKSDSRSPLQPHFAQQSSGPVVLPLTSLAQDCP